MIRRLLGTLVVAIASLGCALQLYRFSRGKKWPVPVISLVIIGSTALVTGLQFVSPEVLGALRRNREALLERIRLGGFAQWLHEPVSSARLVSIGAPVLKTLRHG